MVGSGEGCEALGGLTLDAQEGALVSAGKGLGFGIFKGLIDLLPDADSGGIALEFSGGDPLLEDGLELDDFGGGHGGGGRGDQ